MASYLSLAFIYIVRSLPKQNAMAFYSRKFGMCTVGMCMLCSLFVSLFVCCVFSTVEIVCDQGCNLLSVVCHVWLNLLCDH